MPRISSSYRLGNTSTSALVRSSASIQNEINSYNDSLAAYQYELSPKTAQDLNTYQTYLTGRVTQLQNTGSITDASKALTITKTITSAVRSNVSSDIQRENIQIMSGNATLEDKYNVIVAQFQRAVGIGDLSLAQQLESQAYSVSQSIQYQAQQAAQAGQALAKATTSSNLYAQQGIQASLDEGLKTLNNDIKHVGAKNANKAVGAWVDANREFLQATGVVIPQGAQPNYFDLVKGVQNAKYNSLVLEAQTKAPSDPKGAAALMAKAYNLRTSATTIDTLGGHLTIEEINQAAQDPAMFAYDNSTGKYIKTSQTGYQYVDGHVAPEFSGIVGDARRNQIYFLNPNQTSELTHLGLNFTMNKNGTTGDGVQVQLTENTPQWLKDIFGTQNGMTKVFTDKIGNLQFQGPSTDGNGLSYFTLMTIGGLNGVFEHGADGSTKLIGGNYGFDQGAAQLLINAGQQKQQQIQLQTQAEQQAQAAKLTLAKPAPLPTIAPPPRVAPKPVAAAPLQHTVSAQSIQPTYNPQPKTYNPQQAVAPTSNVQGIPLTQPKLNGIRL
jgi:hypothetical protein